MSFAVVRIETDFHEEVEMALPLNLPSRQVAAQVMRGLGRPVRTGDTFALFIKTPRGEKRIPSTSTLADVGIQDGQPLRIRREAGSLGAAAPTAHAFLRTASGVILPLEGSSIIIGRKDLSYEVPLDLDLTKHDPSRALSRRHACIGHEGGQYYLLDLGSTNGTTLNGRSMVPHSRLPLKDGDVIDFGRGLRLTFITTGPDEGSPR